MGNDLILSIDIGTSATKALLFDADLNQKAISRRTNPIHTMQNGWSEQDPDNLFNGVLDAMTEVLHANQPDNHLAGVVFSSQMYSVLAVDPYGKPLTGSITWLDNRAAEVAFNLRHHPLAAQVCQTTGCPIDAIYPLSKIVWMREHGQISSKIRFISIKDYILYRLTGRCVADWTIGSSSGLMDIQRKKWDPTALSLAGLTLENLPELLSPKSILTGWDQRLAEKAGIPPRTPIILGSGDGPLASVGVGALTSDILAINVGTSAAARCVLTKPTTDPNEHLYTQVLDEEHWVMGGMTSSGGIIYEWFLNEFCSQVNSEGIPTITSIERNKLEQLATEVPPGSDGLIFIPYLSGEQSPDWQPNTRGSFTGLKLGHTRGHLARSVLEGITRSIYRIAEAFQTVPVFQDIQFREIRVTGGLATSPLWLQITADMFGIPVVVPELAEGSARGAAILGWSSLGRLTTMQDYSKSFQAKTRIEPRNEIHAYYQNQPYKEYLDCARNARS
jgi:gluconokinase